MTYDDHFGFKVKTPIVRVTCKQCGKRTPNDVAKLCDKCLEEQGQTQFDDRGE